MTTDTLKQAAQALQRAKAAHEFAEMKRPGFGHAQDVKLCGELAAALEAMAAQRPIAHFQNSGSVELPIYEQVSDEYAGDPDVFPVFAAPIATPEHDAKVRDVALEEAAQAVHFLNADTDIFLRQDVVESVIDAIRALKSTGADHAK